MEKKGLFLHPCQTETNHICFSVLTHNRVLFHCLSLFPSFACSRWCYIAFVCCWVLFFSSKSQSFSSHIFFYIKFYFFSPVIVHAVLQIMQRFSLLMIKRTVCIYIQFHCLFDHEPKLIWYSFSWKCAHRPNVNLIQPFFFFCFEMAP